MINILIKEKIKMGVLLLIVFTMIGGLCFAGGGHLYATWDALEMDTCASAWLIKNFIDTQAEFKFYPKGEFIEEGTAFDTPDAKFRRSGNMSTFETLIKEYGITDKGVLEIAQMIHDIEIDFWIGSLTPQGQAMNQEILTIIREAKNPQEALERSFKVFDELYQSLK